MKKNGIVTAVFIVLLSCMGYAQKIDSVAIPQVIWRRMLMTYPMAQRHPVSWTKEGLLYKGELTILETPAFALIDSTGRLIRKEKKVMEAYLPKQIKDEMTTKYPGYKMIDIFQYTDDKGKETYKTTFQSVQSVIYNPDGTPAAK